MIDNCDMGDWNGENIGCGTIGGGGAGGRVGPLYPGVGLGDVIGEVCRKAGQAVLGTIFGNTATEGEESEESREEICQELKDSVLATCASLKGRKKFACFQAAQDTYDACME